jgi:hypothetical protein
MNKSDLIKLIKISHKLDSLGYFRSADILSKKIANYYPEQSLLSNDNMYSTIPYKDVEDEYEENQELYYKNKPNLRVPEYHDLGGEADGQNIEGQLNGPDSVPGPAAIDPGNVASSPSMAGGDLSSFTWEESYENVSPELRRIPRR